MSLSFARLYEAYDAVQRERRAALLQRQRPRNPLQAYLAQNGGASGKKDGFARMQDCRRALEALDGLGWQRSFHQRLFHDNFIRSCTRVFFKTEPPGAFARAHQAVLDLNGWDTLAQEILISTPRRFGKTISVSMFAAALLYSAKSVELSIYSTCKRISQKLLRNVQKFLRLVFEGTDTPPFKEIRSNMEELVLQGPEGASDVRIVNSYPSKVGRARVLWQSVGRGVGQAAASWKCRTPTVLCAKSLDSFPARAKRSASSCSASSCSAARAPVLHFKSDFRSCPYSRTSREKVARGMLWTGREREFFFAMLHPAPCARRRPRTLPRLFFREGGAPFLDSQQGAPGARNFRPGARCARAPARCPRCTCRRGARRGRWRAPGCRRS